MALTTLLTRNSVWTSGVRPRAAVSLSASVSALFAWAQYGMRSRWSAKNHECFANHEPKNTWTAQHFSSRSFLLLLLLLILLLLLGPEGREATCLHPMWPVAYYPIYFSSSLMLLHVFSRDGKPRTATSTFTQLLQSSEHCSDFIEARKRYFTARSLRILFEDTSLDYLFN